jgi:hypothetical protein
MTLRTVLICGVAALSLLAGCGGDSGRQGGHDNAATTSERSALLAVARCMRAHGYPSFPDPIEFASGGWGFPASAPNPREGPAACDRAVRQGKQTETEGRVSAADMAKLRSYAQCMRREGVADWPDPDADGSFRLPTRLTGTNGKRPVQAQAEACQRYFPEGGINVAPGGSGGS